jgi:hypothetical protein
MSDKYKGCQECFYYFKEHNAFPCNACERYSHYLHKDVYTESQPNQAWQAVVEGLNGTSKDDFKEDDWPDFSDNPHDVVNKPKHYMLFKSSDVTIYSLTGKGIEVRDVIEKLVNKFPPMSGMPVADYVQLMQYLMRFMDKNGIEDLQKARWYLDKMIEALEDA